MARTLARKVVEGQSLPKVQLSVPETLQELNDRLRVLAVQSSKLQYDLLGLESGSPDKLAEEDCSVETRIMSLFEPLRQIEDCVASVLQRYGSGKQEAVSKAVQRKR